MRTMHRWAVALLLGTIPLWVLFVVAVVTTRPEDGANIGAGFLFLLAVPATVTGFVLLAVAARQRTPERLGVAAPGLLSGVPGPRSAQADWGLVLGIIGILVGIFGVGATVASGIAITVVGVAVSVSAVVLGSAVRRRDTAPSGVALAGLVTGIIGLVFAVLKVVGLVLDATIG